MIISQGFKFLGLCIHAGARRHRDIDWFPSRWRPYNLRDSETEISSKRYTNDVMLNIHMWSLNTHIQSCYLGRAFSKVLKVFIGIDMVVIKLSLDLLKLVPLTACVESGAHSIIFRFHCLPGK